MLLDPCVIGTGQLLDKCEAFGLKSCYVIELKAAVIELCSNVFSKTRETRQPLGNQLMCIPVLVHFVG